MPYTPEKPPLPETPDQLRARIPGWGADADPAVRPAVPREQPGIKTGAHWHLPDRQPEHQPRERSIEHAMLTPVFGTVAPLKGLSGTIRRYAYARHGEGKAAHWLLLIVGDRVDALEETVRSFATRQPDDLVAETGIRAEVSGHGWRSRVGRGRTDLVHQPIDPVLVLAPWVLAVGLVVAGARAAAWGRRGR